MTVLEGPAARAWREGLESWAIPAAILEAAPRSPYGFSVSTFDRAADDALRRRTPSSDIAAEALPEGGTVLDIGCGVGAASLPLADRASLILGVDESTEMLDAFRERCAAMGVALNTHVGRWPQVAPSVPVADVVVCRNVAYNVPLLATFTAAMTRHARHRVVMELTERHPISWMNPMWETVHGVVRPDRPTIEDALAVLREIGVEPSITRWESPWLLAAEPEEALVDFVLHRLCLPEERREDARALLQEHPVPVMQPTATVWWSGFTG